MALVTKLANLLQKNRDSKAEVEAYLKTPSFLEEWQGLIEGELKRTNDTNNRNLGGQ